MLEQRSTSISIAFAIVLGAAGAWLSAQAKNATAGADTPMNSAPNPY